MVETKFLQNNDPKETSLIKYETTRKMNPPTR